MRMDKIIRDILLLILYAFISYAIISAFVFITAAIAHLHFSLGLSIIIWLIFVFVNGIQ